MLKGQVNQSVAAQTLFPWHMPFVLGNGRASFPILPKPTFHKKHTTLRVGYIPSNTKALATSSTIGATHASTSIKAVVTVGLLTNLDNIEEPVCNSLLLEFVPAELDPDTGSEKETIKGYAHRTSQVENEVKYELDLVIPEEFGKIGAVLVKNGQPKEIYLKYIAVDGYPNGTIKVTCNSWVHSKSDNPDDKRIFFTNKAYLPSQTPSGLKQLRGTALKNMRGDGQGERKTFERIYDYDVYNDIGDPHHNELSPVLGGKEHPYPRRCRTGRLRSQKDPLSESRSDIFYVPRDEDFSKEKSQAFSSNTLHSVLHSVVPLLDTVFDSDIGFQHFTDIDRLYKERIEPNQTEGTLTNLLKNLVKYVTDIDSHVLYFETPEMINRDKFSWSRDAEFCRQTLAGLNPFSIQLVTEWPLKSKLDQKEYGAPESAITKELVTQEIKGFMTFEEALEQKKLFIIDYHDLLLPFVNKVREIEGTTLYGSRTLMFLTPDGILRPLAIELTRPPAEGKPLWRKVFTPCWDATGAWLWKLAKAHVLAHDSCYHEIVSHLLRTHCATEPYIIATNRQLSTMHPIYKLLHPHFRYTMKINAMARQQLINANGVIESSFSLGKYSMELCSVAYDLQWRFDLQALPKDLISRGMAVEDPSAPHGLKLTIEDYPFANDGLLLWDIMKQWVSNYVNHYYPEASMVESDEELQAWWTEIRTVGHADKKDEPWWPVLRTPKDLIGILTTIIWVASAHHSAVNFGQYAFAGYFPNRPTIARTKMPTEDPSDEEWKSFVKRPEETLLACFPSQIQATKVMAMFDVLSNHSPDEEYIGGSIEPSWVEDPAIKSAFEEFSGKLKEVEGIIDKRNADDNLKNRTGAGVVPYELLKPFSEPGVTGKGVPNSISI